MANIRDQCSWVHMRQKEEATHKAKDLVRMAVANARLIRPLSEVGLPVTHKGLVIGGGVAGMTSALKLAEQGFEIFLLDPVTAFFMRPVVQHLFVCTNCPAAWAPPYMCIVIVGQSL